MLDTALAKTADFDAARRNMVESQLRPNKVTDERILMAMERLPRELFVSAAVQGIAYIDEDVAIGPGRFLLEPMVFGRLLQEAEIDAQDRVLDVGCGQGYSAAVLAGMAGEVVALEQSEVFLQQAATHLNKFGIHNVQLTPGNLTEGYAGRAPYNVIIVNGAVAGVPEALMAQLAEGGRLMAVVCTGKTGTGKARRYEKHHGQISSRELFDANSPYLPGFEPRSGFTF
ncbi:MAG: methyltransferase domain-containing protein [Alphaproteobacteria bacterium]|nr:methyltransferase domain-containing protein [Alphaproteobacteria bacterium]